MTLYEQEIHAIIAAGTRNCMIAEAAIILTVVAFITLIIGVNL